MLFKERRCECGLKRWAETFPDWRNNIVPVQTERACDFLMRKELHWDWLGIKPVHVRTGGRSKVKWYESSLG